MNDQADLSVQLSGKRSKAAGKLSADDLVRIDFLLPKPLQLTQLFGFQTDFIADNADGDFSSVEILY